MTNKGTPSEGFSPESSPLVLEQLAEQSTSFDGFVRERAVRMLGALGTPRAVPYLVVRANDWVPQVRAAAYAALTKLINAGHADAFVASLPAIVHLQDCRRGDHSLLLQAVRRLLLRKENLPALVAAVQSPDVRVARLASRLLVEHRPIPLAEIVARCLTHSDVLVRSKAVDLLRVLDEDDFKAAAATALRDSYMPVRREAFQQLLRRDRSAGLQAARNHLFDPSAAIRELAIQHLLAAGESVEELYTEAFNHNGNRVSVVTCALWAWGVMNCQSRVGQIRALLDAPFASMRRSALQAVTRLLQEGANPHLRHALADPSPAVCKEAARLLCKLNLVPSVERLIDIAVSSDAEHVAYACCRVIRQGNKWEWLQFILTIYGADGCNVPPEVLSGEVNSWQARFNRSSAQPDPRVLEKIVALLRSCRTRLTESQARLLEFTLRSYGVNP